MTTYSVNGKKIGRPFDSGVLYTQEIADEVCQRLADGESLEAICRDAHLPAASTIRHWAMKNRDGFAAQYHEARTLQAEKFLDDMRDISNDATKDYVDRVDAQGNLVLDAQGNVVKIRNKEHVERTRLRIDTLKWIMAKTMPRKYGDKLDVTSTNTNLNLNGTAPHITTNDPTEAVRAYQRMIAGDDNDQ